MDAWGIDVTVAGSQKGLMLPTGMSITGVSNKALEVSRKTKVPRHYFNWELMNGRAPQKFIGTAPVHLFFGLQESLKMLEEEGLDAVFARHARLAEATRAAVRAWGADGKGPQLYGQTDDRLSNSVTTVLMPEGMSSDPMRKIALERFNLSLGGGLGPADGQGVPHRPSRRPQRADAAGLPRHHRARHEDGRRAVRAGRRRRRDQVAGELASSLALHRALCLRSAPES